MIEQPRNQPAGFDGGDPYYGIPDLEAQQLARLEAEARFVPVVANKCWSCRLPIDDGKFCDDCEWERRKGERK
mgnify:CR=1 FL=1